MSISPATAGVFFADGDENGNEMAKIVWIFVDWTKSKTKVKIRDEIEAKINGILALTKMSDAKFCTINIVDIV